MLTCKEGEAPRVTLQFNTKHRMSKTQTNRQSFSQTGLPNGTLSILEVQQMFLNYYYFYHLK